MSVATLTVRLARCVALFHVDRLRAFVRLLGAGLRRLLLLTLDLRCDWLCYSRDTVIRDNWNWLINTSSTIKENQAMYIKQGVRR